jgi:Holliday junction resolvase
MGSSTLRTGIGGQEKTRKAKGGRQPYIKGAVAERRVQKALEAYGCLVTRQPKSQSPYDLMCIHPSGMVDLVQVKSRPYIPPAERRALEKMAFKWGCRPILAWIEVNTLRRRWLGEGEELAELPCPR